MFSPFTVLILTVLLAEGGSFSFAEEAMHRMASFFSQNETTSCAGLAQVVILSTYSTGPSP